MSNRTIYLSILYAILVLVVTLSGASGILRFVIALPLIIFIPGFLLVGIFFREKANNFLELIAYSVGISLSLIVLGGLILNLTPMGINAVGWAIWLSGITLLECLISILMKKAPNTGWKIEIRPDYKLKMRPYEMVLIILSLILVGVSLIYARNFSQQQHSPPFTQLWILADKGNVVQVGVKSYELTRVHFRLDITDGKGKIFVTVPLDLDPLQQWTSTFEKPEGEEKVEAILYKAEDYTTPYRNAWTLLK